MKHKKEYKVNGSKVAKYNRNYYLKHRKKLLEKALRRLVIKREVEKNRIK